MMRYRGLLSFLFWIVVPFLLAGWITFVSAGWSIGSSTATITEPPPCNVVSTVSSSGYPFPWNLTSRAVSTACFGPSLVGFHRTDWGAVILDLLFYMGIYWAIALSIMGGRKLVRRGSKKLG